MKKSIVALTLSLTPFVSFAQGGDAQLNTQDLLCSEVLIYDFTTFNTIAFIAAAQINDKSYERLISNAQRKGMAQPDFAKACATHKEKTVKAVANYLMKPDVITTSGNWAYSEQLREAESTTNFNGIKVATNAGKITLKGFTNSCFDTGIRPQEEFNAIVNGKSYKFRSYCFQDQVGTLYSSGVNEDHLRVEHLTSESMTIRLSFLDKPIEFNGSMIKPLCDNTSLYCPRTIASLPSQNSLSASQISELGKLKKESNSKLNDIFDAHN